MGYSTQHLTVKPLHTKICNRILDHLRVESKYDMSSQHYIATFDETCQQIFKYIIDDDHLCSVTELWSTIPNQIVAATKLWEKYILPNEDNSSRIWSLRINHRKSLDNKVKRKVYYSRCPYHEFRGGLISDPYKQHQHHWVRAIPTSVPCLMP